MFFLYNSLSKHKIYRNIERLVFQMKKKYTISLAILICFLLFYFLYADYKESSIKDGIKISVSSKKSTYYYGEIIIVDVYVKIMKPYLVEYSATPPCSASPTSISLLYNVNEEVYDYYQVETIESNHEFADNITPGVPSANCHHAEENRYLIPGQILHEKIKFTPLLNTTLPSDTYVLKMEGIFTIPNESDILTGDGSSKNNYLPFSLRISSKEGVK